MASSRTLSMRVGDLVQRALVLELGAVVALFIGFHAYTIAVDTVLDPYFLDSDLSLSILRGVLVLLGMSALVVSTVVWRDYSLPVSMPDRTDGRLIGAAVVGTAFLATLPFLLFTLRTEVGILRTLLLAPDVAGGFLDRTLVRITLFVSGMVLLYHGLVQGALQRVFGHEHDRTVAITTLVGVYLVTPNVVSYGTFATGPWIHLWGNRGAIAVLFVLALGIAVYADERVTDHRVRILAMLPVAAAVGLVVLVLATTVDTPEAALVVLTRVGVVGVAAYAYDRTVSIVTPALIYATFAIVSTLLHSASIAAIVGA